MPLHGTAGQRNAAGHHAKFFRSRFFSTRLFKEVKLISRGSSRGRGYASTTSALRIPIRHCSSIPRPCVCQHGCPRSPTAACYVARCPHSHEQSDQCHACPLHILASLSPWPAACVSALSRHCQRCIVGLSDEAPTRRYRSRSLWTISDEAPTRRSRSRSLWMISDEAPTRRREKT